MNYDKEVKTNEERKREVALKTPLPEKIKSSIRFEPTDQGVQERQITAGEVANTVNQLITYLAELTEVVEGKMDNWTQVKVETRAYPASTAVIGTPSLKEQLLGEIKKLDCLNEIGGNMVFEDDVEAIINRLMP
jgi:hypothetical protein